MCLYYLRSLRINDRTIPEQTAGREDKYEGNHRMERHVEISSEWRELIKGSKFSS